VKCRTPLIRAAFSSALHAEAAIGFMPRTSGGHARVRCRTARSGSRRTAP
jgi:hypothetical protein